MAENPVESGYTPYYAEDGVTLYLGDCIEVMESLPDTSVDVVLTDPPYSSGGGARIPAACASR